MDLFLSLLKMLGGLALLIYGMKMLSSQLKKLSGGKLDKILSTVTDNPFKGLLVGFLITVATQSSTTTTVIVVSLVNSGILGLRNSIPIIIGSQYRNNSKFTDFTFSKFGRKQFNYAVFSSKFSSSIIINWYNCNGKCQKTKNKRCGADDFTD